MGLALGCGGFSSRPVAAQVTEGVTLDPIVSHSVARSGFRTNDMINGADCLADDRLNFQMTVAGNQNTEVQIWAGAGCEVPANRSPSAQAPCWMLFNMPVANGSMIAELHARDILSGRTLHVPGGTTPVAPVGTLVDGVGLAACDPSNVEPSEVLEIQLFFMLVDDNSSVIGNTATWTARAKIGGPLPPAQVSVESGSERLRVRFRYDNDQSPDVAINGYTFYCDPPPSSVMTTAADAADAQPRCDDSKTELMAGSIADAKYRCATASISATEAELLHLQASQPYHVAMAASDTFDNIGPLSTVACGVPRTRDVEARACSVSRRRAPHGVGLCSVAFALWGLGFARRRASAKRRA